MRVLIVEDDRETADFIRRGLFDHDHDAEIVDDAQWVFDRIESGSYDALILDRMLPGMDGLTVLRTLRERNCFLPVMILSALGEVDDRVRGLRAGGDDYLVKPFSFLELLARLEGIARRVRLESQNQQLRMDDLILDRSHYKVTRGGTVLRLQPRELRLLEYLLLNADKVVTRAMLLEHVWDYHFDPQTNVIDVHISRLRNKIDRGFSIPLLHTVRGVGYRLSVTP